MRKDTLNVVKRHIEQLNSKDLKFVKIYLSMAKLFDSPEAIDHLTSIIRNDNYQIFNIEYYLINVYCFMTGTSRPSKELINDFSLKHKKDIENYCKRNFIKNYNVATHSFNGVLKGAILKQGIMASRTDDVDMRKLYSIASKYLAPFCCSNANRSSICCAKIPSNGVVEYATSSPEWMEQFLNSCFDVTYEEYAMKDSAIINAKIADKLKELEQDILTGKTAMSSGEFIEFTNLTKKFVDFYVKKQNPCFAIINKELSQKDVEEAVQQNISLFSYDNMIRMDFSAIETNKDIPPSDLTIVDLPVHRMKKINTSLWAE